MASVWLATPKDVPRIASMIAQLAKFERLENACVATEQDYAATLFNTPPFAGPTVYLLGVDASKSQEDAEESEFFRVEGNRIVIGFVLFFPNYSTFLAKPGIYIEDLFIREAYRRQGYGTLLLREVAKEAANRGLGRVEWCVLDWNENAIKFYEQMGALCLPDWRICRLTGDALKAYGNLK